MKKMLRRSMFLVALLVSLCMPVVAQNANTTLNLDQVSGTNVLSASGEVYYIQNVATGLYLKAGGEWGTNAVEGRAAHPFYLEKRTDGSYAISSVAGYLHSTDMWADWKLRNDSRWTITKVSGLASGVNQFYLVNANGRALSSQGHVTGQLMMDKHHAASYAQKWIFITEAQMKSQMSGATATKPMDITPLIKASSFDLVDGVVMNDPDEEEPWKDDNGNNISSLPLYSNSKLTQAAYNRYWSNFATYGRFNWHSMIRGGWGETSVYNGVGIISEGNMSNAINITQTVNSLPKGKYYFSFEGFYRYQTRSGWGGLFDAIVGAFSDIKFQVVISAGNTTIKTFDLQANTNIAIDSEPVEKAGQEVAKVFRDNDNYKQFYEFDLTSQSNVTITIRKTYTSSSNAWICVDNFALVYYGAQSNTPDVEDLSELYNSRLEAYIAKIRNELSNYPGASTELRNQALGVFNDGIVDVEDAMDNKIITTEELYREALSVIDQAYREALALLNKPVEGDKTYLIGNPSFEDAMGDMTNLANEWVKLDNTREASSIATDKSYVGKSAGMPLVQTVRDLPYGLYRMTADVTSDAGNTVYLMGNYYHKGVVIEETNKMQPVELYFLLDDGYNDNSDKEGSRFSIPIGVIGGSGEGNRLYNFHGGLTTGTYQYEATKQEPYQEPKYADEPKVTGKLTLSSKSGSISLDSNKGKVDFTSDGSWRSSGYLRVRNGNTIKFTAKANANETLLINSVTIICTSKDDRCVNKNTVSGGTATYPSGSPNIVITATTGGSSEITIKTPSDGTMYVDAIEVECTRTYISGYETKYKTVSYTETIPYEALTADQAIQGCPFKVDNFKLYLIGDVPNGRLFMELQKARNAQFTDGVTADIAQYESMFQNRSVSNDASSDWGYNPAIRVMEILRNTAKQQRSEGADMTYAIFNQNFDYWDGHGWSMTESAQTFDAVNHFAYTTSATDAEGRKLFNNWWTGTHMTQTIAGIPNGRYKLEAMVASGDPGNPGTVYLTAQTSAQEELYMQGVIDESCGKVFKNVSLEFDVTDGSATIGVVGGTDPADANTLGDFTPNGHWWYKADNFRLTYLGKSITFEERAATIEQVQDYYTTVTVNRPIKAKDAEGKYLWNSFVVPFDIPAELLEGWEVKELVNSELKNNGEHISLVFGDAPDGIKAGVPYMVRNKSLDETVPKIVMNNVNVDTKNFNHRLAGNVAFVGVYTRQYVPLGAYFISGNKFYQSVNENKRDNISGFRGYFQLEENAQTANVRSLSFRIEGEDDTDIEEVLEDGNLEVVGIYDVNGIRLTEMQPGINILRMSDGTTNKVLVK